MVKACSPIYLFKNESENPLISFKSHPITTKAALQYFNTRVTQRLHRYRSMKRQWQEISASIQSISSLPIECGSPLLLPIVMKNSIELNPLHSRIQQDLIELRNIIKRKQGKFHDNSSSVPLSTIRPLGELTSIPTTFDNQENNNIEAIRKASPSHKVKALDCVKISGCQMRSSTLPKSDSTDSGIGSTSNSSSTCSQYSKQQQKIKRQCNNKTFNICYSRINPLPPPLPSDSPIYHAIHLSKKKSNISFKMTQNIRSKPPLTSRLSLHIPQIPPLVKKKQVNFVKQESRSPIIPRLPQIGDLTTRLYTYAASSSTATPRSMMLKRNTSLLPILLQSCSCIGIQPQEDRSKKLENDLEEEKEKTNNNDDYDDNDYYQLLEYKHLINRLPKSIISLRPRCGQDDYGILFEQLNHIRRTMPDSNIYDEYARIA